MKGFTCKVCGYISINGSAPEKCPVCGAPKTAFQEKENAIITPKDPKNLSELEKKHVPVISVVKKCVLIPEGCQDVHVKVGEIQHPSTSEHFIIHIDCYVDNEFVSRAILAPEKANPAASIHLRAKGNKFQAIPLCNLHGAWISEITL